MKANWTATAEFLLMWEGSKIDDDPNDAGELTHWGIDQRSHPQLSREEIIALTWPDAAEIHKSDTWSKLRCDDLPDPLDMIVCDTAVLCGNFIAAVWLQVAVGTLPDGRIGDKTVRAASRAGEILTSARAIFEMRENYHETVCFLNPSQSKFLVGWLNRVDSLRKVARGV